MSTARMRARRVAGSPSDEPIDVAWRRVRDLEAALEGGDAPSAVRAAIALASSMTRGKAHDAIAASARAFRDGHACDDAWPYLALRARAVLAKAGAVLRHGMLNGALASLDAALDPHREALLLLDDADYAQAARALPRDDRAWWSYPARVDAAIPAGALARALDALTQNVDASMTKR